MSLLALVALLLSGPRCEVGVYDDALLMCYAEGASEDLNCSESRTYDDDPTCWEDDDR